MTRGQNSFHIKGQNSMAKRGPEAASSTKRKGAVSDQYTRILIPDPDGGYTAEILELPGCLAEGDTTAEAISRVDQAKDSWVAAAREAGQAIPEPFNARGFSGNVALRLPKGLHKRVARMAEREQTSMNQWLVAAVAEKVGSKEMYNRLLNDVRSQIQIGVFRASVIADLQVPLNPIAHAWQHSMVNSASPPSSGMPIASQSVGFESGGRNG